MAAKSNAAKERKPTPFDEVVKRLLDTPPPTPRKTKAKRRPK
jgi:hypothetical protein